MTPPFHVMSKPTGAICNLDCKYCFYLEKENLYPGTRQWRMSDEVLTAYVRQTIESANTEEVQFAWQGGEPTLAGLDFFQRAVDLQRQFGAGRKIANAVQTNGTLLDERWCAFFSANEFLVGLSLDGPREVHDLYRVDKRQQPTFDAVVRGAALLQRHGVAFNTLTVVHRESGDRGVEIYEFLKGVGSGYMQFIPVVERAAPTRLKVLGMDFAEPGTGEVSAVTPFSVGGRQYGDFLSAIFDRWVRSDVGRVFVQMFDVALGNWMGLGSSLCVFAERCGNAVALEHNGDLFSCDHYVYPRYRLGNILNQSMGEMVGSTGQRKFGDDKADTLPAYCRRCEVKFACQGECPKHRFISTPDGDAGLNYLCAGYKRFFTHVDPYMKRMAGLLNAGRPAAEIMGVLDRLGRTDGVCLCGSGMRYRRCCGRR